MALLFLSTADRGAVWQPLFEAAGEAFILGADAVTDPSEVTHVVCWVPPEDLTVYPNLRVVISTGAGVDQMPDLPEGVELVRTEAPGIAEMVRDWVVMATLMLHRDMPTYLEQQRGGTWAGHAVPMARGTKVGVMGMGRIGTLVAQSLDALGFDVLGWSRSGTPVAGVEVFDASGFDSFLGQTDILICLLPLTDQTAGLMDAAFFAKLPKGAKLVQAGRGAQLDLDALRQALDAGHVSCAMLDVTDPEPLPQDHWAWADPRIVITPHVAASTDAAEGARHAIEVVRAGREGRALPGLVPHGRGY